MELSTEVILGLIIAVQTVIIIVQAFGQHNSVPVDIAALLVDYLADVAAKTPSTLDDKLVELADEGVNILKPQAPKVNPDALPGELDA
jgi:hypothetical protein